MDEPNDHNNVLRTISLSDLVRGHTEDSATRMRITISDTLPSMIAESDFSIPWSLITTPSLADITTLMPELEYTVPSNTFAESCPSCDEIALENTDQSFIARYPRGWVLVACKRHAQMLKANGTGKRIFVGGIPELRSKAANRFHERESKRRQEKAAEKRAIATAAISTGDETSSTPPSLSASSGTTTSTTQKDPCPICISNPPTLRLDCTHSFCKPCLTHWQQNSTDQALSAWISSTPSIQQSYPILAANLKSRFTCPMCRTYAQFTRQSRRKKKIRKQVGRGEEVGVLSARSRRGGKRRRRRPRVGDGLRSEMNPSVETACVVAPDSMPVVERAQASQADSTGVN